MRYPALVAASVIVLTAIPAMAQTSAPMTKRQLRAQDRAECSKQVDRYHADEFLMCMTNREAARKVAAKAKKAEAKKEAAAEIAVKREKAAQDFQATVKAHEQWNKERLALIAQERAKRTDCKKQAADQKLHYVKRLRFIETCMAAK